MTELHLSDERLSAYLDEVDDVAPPGAPELQPHLAQCARCNDRLAALRSAGRLVGAPVVRVAPEVRAQAVAAAVRAEREVERARKIRWYRRPQVLAGAAAAVVVLGLGVAVPLTLAGQSSSSPTAASRIRNSPQRHASAGFAPAAKGSAAVSAGSVEDLGRVSSMKQVLSRLSEVVTPRFSKALAGPSYNAGATSTYASCVATTRAAARAGDYGPGIVASATYQGRASLVMEFWTTASAPPSGKTVVAVTTTNGCKLLARTTT
jgi:anti-sigma factor RsiW